MKLIDILVKEFKEWPEGVAFIFQNKDKNMLVGVSTHTTQYTRVRYSSECRLKGANDLASDQRMATVTRKEWEAAKATHADKTCTWLNNGHYGFKSQCGHTFHNDDGTIDWMNYCPFCGGEVVCNG